MIVLKEFSVNAILPLISFYYTSNMRQSKINLSGYMVKTSSLTLQVFKKSIRCAGCGLVGNTFKLVADSIDKNPYLHFCFIDSKREIAFTKDHIIPISLGGPTILKNLQTMYSPCNDKKKDKIYIKYLRNDFNLLLNN